MADQQDIELLAQLVGTTSAELKKVDEQIVSPSTNLQRSADNWNPHNIVKSHITGMGGQAVGQAAPQVQPPNSYTPPSEEEIQKMVPAGGETPPPAPVMQPVASVSPDLTVRLDHIEKKLDILLARVDNIEVLDKKFTSFVDRGLKDRVKQITLKLDDNKSQTKI